MSQKTSKLLRRVATLTGKTDTYIKTQYKGMSPSLRVSYLAFMRENFKRFEEMRKNPQTETVILDQKVPEVQ